jgi:hypothetical protein
MCATNSRGPQQPVFGALAQEANRSCLGTSRRYARRFPRAAIDNSSLKQIFHATSAPVRRCSFPLSALRYIFDCEPPRCVCSPFDTGCSSAWLERLVWDQEVASSNLVTPTSMGHFASSRMPQFHRRGTKITEYRPMDIVTEGTAVTNPRQSRGLTGICRNWIVLASLRGYLGVGMVEAAVDNHGSLQGGV